MNPAQELYVNLSNETGKVVIGKEESKKIIFATFLVKGNILIEGVPGIAKTLLARVFARAMGLRFSRIQFTPDLMPSDILGSSMYNQGKGAFEFVPGPIFSDFILADEINRAPAKTQAALLESMEEKQVTIDNCRYDMSENFMVFATQNPLEFEGTYTLPEAQLDRFMVRILFDYPDAEEELAVLESALEVTGINELLERVQPPTSLPLQIRNARDFVGTVVVDNKILLYIRDLIGASRSLDELLLGNSPRSGQMLLRLSRAYAALEGSTFVTPDHVRELVPHVLPHRWVIKPEAEIQQTPVESILRALFDTVKVPE
ncbi:MAG: AAA family ATPase [Chitinispirillaceae bacterium]|nr:AAA family ATPase [Chitinispirillaceae bacterium]